MNLTYFFREKKWEKIKEKNISLITEIVNVEKVSNWKSLPFGYIPDGERQTQTLDISKINDGLPAKNNSIYGYKYRFTVMVNGQSKTTQTFIKPFPEKYRA